MLIAQAPNKKYVPIHYSTRDQIHKYFSLAGYISNVL